MNSPRKATISYGGSPDRPTSLIVLSASTQKVKPASAKPIALKSEILADCVCI
jgi:hypothetical protein